MTTDPKTIEAAYMAGFNFGVKSAQHAYKLAADLQIAGCVKCRPEPHVGGYGHCECDCHAGQVTFDSDCDDCEIEGGGHQGHGQGDHES